MPQDARIHVFGASGSGTTTLSRALAAPLDRIRRVHRCVGECGPGVLGVDLVRGGDAAAFDCGDLRDAYQGVRTGSRFQRNQSAAARLKRTFATMPTRKHQRDGATRPQAAQKMHFEFV